MNMMYQYVFGAGNTGNHQIINGVYKIKNAQSGQIFSMQDELSFVADCPPALNHDLNYLKQNKNLFFQVEKDRNTGLYSIQNKQNNDYLQIASSATDNHLRLIGSQTSDQTVLFNFINVSNGKYRIQLRCVSLSNDKIFDVQQRGNNVIITEAAADKFDVSTIDDSKLFYLQPVGRYIAFENKFQKQSKRFLWTERHLVLIRNLFNNNDIQVWKYKKKPESQSIHVYEMKKSHPNSHTEEYHMKQVLDIHEHFQYLTDPNVPGEGGHFKFGIKSLNHDYVAVFRISNGCFSGKRQWIDMMTKALKKPEFDGSYQIMVPQHNKFVDILEYQQAEGSPIVLRNFAHNDENQKWIVKPIKIDKDASWFYTINSVKSGLFITSPPGDEDHDDHTNGLKQFMRKDGKEGDLQLFKFQKKKVIDDLSKRSET